MAESERSPFVRRMGRLVRLVGYVWTAPNTLLGLVVAPLAWLPGGHAQVVDGVLELGGRPFARLLNLGVIPIGALTLGHVVLGRDQRALDATRLHERVHVRQYEIFGPFFLPCYLLCSLSCWVRRKDAYRDNPFERAAYAVERREAESRAS